MGVVYKAYDPKLNRGVALKLIGTKGGPHDECSDRSTRLLRETQALAQLNHPNLGCYARLFQVGIPGAVALLGTTLSNLQASWLNRASRVLLLLDGDQAGRKAAPAIANKLSTVSVVHQLPENLEPEDLSDYQLASLARSYLLSPKVTP